MSASKSTAKLKNILSRYHFIVALLFVLLFALIEGVFLYKNFFRALRETKTLIELKEQAVLEPLKLNLFERAVKLLEDKKNITPFNLEGLRDPFSKNNSAAPE